MSITTDRRAPRLTQNDLARLNDAALEVILGHGVDRPSIDVELALWRALNAAHERVSRGPAWWRLVAGSPSRQEVLGALAAAAFQVAFDSAAATTDLAETERDLLFAFHLVDHKATARAALVV